MSSPQLNKPEQSKQLKLTSNCVVRNLPGKCDYGEGEEGNTIFYLQPHEAFKQLPDKATVFKITW